MKTNYHAIYYKVLIYLYECLEEGIYPNVYKCEEVAGVNRIYYEAVIDDMLENGYARCDIKTYPKTYQGLSITCKGVEFLEENTKMAKAKEFLGAAFEATLKIAIEATKAL